MKTRLAPASAVMALFVVLLCVCAWPMHALASESGEDTVFETVEEANTAESVDDTQEAGATPEAIATPEVNATQETNAAGNPAPTNAPSSTDPSTTPAAPATTNAPEASPVAVSLTRSSGGDTEALSYGSYELAASFDPGETLTVSAQDGSTLGSLYVKWYAIPGPWTLRYNDASGQSHQQSCGQNDFLHEYIVLEGSGATSCELSFPNGAEACTLDAYTPGAAPAGVQTWNPPCDKADFLVCSTHADDEILWLGGVLATYTGGRGLATQVAYMTNYWNGDVRREHEKLDGLWAIGVRNYPVNASFEDVYAEDLETAQAIYNQDEVSAFFTGLVRRFKPLVVVCQDFAGEYGHGGHQVLALAVQEAVDKGADAMFCSDTAQTYGTWDVPKTYYHLYDQNRITLDLHQPIANLGGMTAIEAQQNAYEKHTSQQWTWFYVSDDPNDPYASQINCSEFGLYRSTVGPDTSNDMLEHVTTYEEQEAAAEQEAQLSSVEADATEGAESGQTGESEEHSQASASENESRTSAEATGLRIPIYVIALIVALVIVAVACLVLLIIH
ncbi:MAG: PIG-L family deacetylase [Atopobiaceae bacterium]|nr:PIG-L family deacetylase [Atopobiaceae bacterium]MBR3313389.1 PIG-L family deacetylase [Atopobiaceae bacterium]